jgi:hypothetical protein
MSRAVRRRPVTLTLPGMDAAPRPPTPLSRATSAKKAREAPAPKPWQAVVLAVDTGNRAGWAVNVAGKQREFGEANSVDLDALRQIIRWARRLAKQAELPLVMVLEVHPWVGSLRVAQGLSAAKERWKVAWRCEELPDSKLVSVTPSEWRRAVLGKFWVKQPRAEVRKQELLVAEAYVGEKVRGDEAPALLIARWAMHAVSVGKVLGVRGREASMRAWREHGW